MRKILTLISLFCASALSVRAQIDLEKEFFSLPDSVSNEYLDSLSISVSPPNDYWLVGAYGGANVQFGFFNPTRLTRGHWAGPVYGVSIMRHFTMFGIFHNMGLELGVQQNYEGYEFKFNKETGYRATESGAYKVTMKVPEVYFLSHFHVDMGEHFKLMAKVGMYGGYRTSIHRTLDDAYAPYPAFQQYMDTFRDYDRRWSYGVHGGVGMGLMFSPVEFHIMAQVKWGWNSFWLPDYASQYYYRFAYPLDGAITFGVYYQLTPRYGHTRAQLKKLARKMVQEQYEQHE